MQQDTRLLPMLHCRATQQCNLTKPTIATAVDGGAGDDAADQTRTTEP